MSNRIEQDGLLRNSGGYLCDTTGAALVVYRGEHGASTNLIHTRTPFSITFSSMEAAKVYALQPNISKDNVIEPRVVSAIVRITSPVVNAPDDGFIDIPVLIDRVGRANTERIALKLANHIYNTNNWEEGFAEEFESVADLLARAPERFDQLYLDLYPILDDEECVCLLKNAGFDGAIHMGNGETFGQVEYRVFDVAQIQPLTVSCAQTGQPLEHFNAKIRAGAHLFDDNEWVEESAPDPEFVPSL